VLLVSTKGCQVRGRLNVVKKTAPESWSSDGERVDPGSDTQLRPELHAGPNFSVKVYQVVSALSADESSSK